MGREQGPDYYDAHMDRVREPLEQSPWLDVYTAAASLLPPPPAAGPIADIGCGTGRFARLLRDKGYTKYWGVDFSVKRVEEARRYVPDFDFTAAGVFDPAVVAHFADFQIFTFIEVLEHIENDLELLAHVPRGALMIISLPNYDSGGHVRHFESPDAIRLRYHGLIDFNQGKTLTCNRAAHHRKRIFISSGVKI